MQTLLNFEALTDANVKSGNSTRRRETFTSTFPPLRHVVQRVQQKLWMDLYPIRKLLLDETFLIKSHDWALIRIFPVLSTKGNSSKDSDHMSGRRDSLEHVTCSSILSLLLLFIFVRRLNGEEITFTWWPTTDFQFNSKVPFKFEDDSSRQQITCYIHHLIMPSSWQGNSQLLFRNSLGAQPMITEGLVSPSCLRLRLRMDKSFGTALKGSWLSRPTRSAYVAVVTAKASIFLYTYARQSSSVVHMALSRTINLMEMEKAVIPETTNSFGDDAVLSASLHWITKL